jgi:Ca-activated chloride channel family protein
MGRFLRASCAAAFAAAASGLLLAQQPPPQQPPIFKGSSGVTVSVFPTVSDADKRLVPNLTQDAFEILDNDKPQTITVFDNKPRPITVVVMLDTSGSMTMSLDLLRHAAQEFLIRLRPDDKARVGAFNDKIQFGSAFTNDRDALVADVKDLDYGNGTRLWDATAASLDELKPVDGRRVILLFTDGDDTTSHVGLGTVIERARAEDVMVYTIGLESHYFDGERMVTSRPDRGLRKVADETGGGYFELKKTDDLAPTFTRVERELHSQYAIAFEAQQLDGKIHKLQVRMKQPGLTARARRSYLAVAEKAGTEK